MYKNIVFDVDGTLVDTEDACIKALQMLVKSRLRRDISAEECRFSIGIPGNIVLPILGIEYTENTMHEWDIYYAKLIDHTKIFDGIVPLLEELKARKFRLGIVTSRSKIEMAYDPNMELIRHFFGTEVLADDTHEHKPTPIPMLHYLKRTGAQAEETLYIGDTIYDWQCAKNAGVDFALAKWGASSIEEIKAKYLLGKPSNLLMLLGDMTQAEELAKAKI